MSSGKTSIAPETWFSRPLRCTASSNVHLEEPVAVSCHLPSCHELLKCKAARRCRWCGGTRAHGDQQSELSMDKTKSDPNSSGTRAGTRVCGIMIPVCASNGTMQAVGQTKAWLHRWTGREGSISQGSQLFSRTNKA